MTKKDRYVFPAIFTHEKDGISITFPDLQGCLTCGNDIHEASYNAKEAMSLHLYGMEQDDDVIPEPTSINKIETNGNEAIMLIEVWMPVFRDSIDNKAIKKTLTIPKWLDDVATKEKVNFSHVLQKALKEQLGIKDKDIV